MATPKPKRAFTLTMEIGADSLDGLIEALGEIAYSLHAGSRHVITGGYSWGGYWDVVEDPDMTHDRYMAANDAFIAALEQTNGNA